MLARLERHGAQSQQKEDCLPSIAQEIKTGEISQTQRASVGGCLEIPTLCMQCWSGLAIPNTLVKAGGFGMWLKLHSKGLLTPVP